MKYELKFRNRQIQIANQATCFDFSPMETHGKKALDLSVPQEHDADTD